MTARREYGGGGLWSPSDLERRHRGHFFDPATMRAFGSRILDGIYPAAGGGRSYFVTSEQDRSGSAWDGQRRYTVRAMTWLTGEIDEPGDDEPFGAFHRSSTAHRAARAFAEADTVGFAGLPCPLRTHRLYSQPVTYRRRTYCGACVDEVQRHPFIHPRATIGRAIAAMKAGAL